MNVDQGLLQHPFWKMTDPEAARLVRTYDLPPEANPFAEDEVVIRVAAAAGETPYHKWPMAREGIRDGILKGLIVRGTTVVEATSGNTGHAMACACTALGLKFVAVMAKDVPGSKIDIIRALGDHISVQTPGSGETTVERARHLGTQKGWHNPDQYGGSWNPQAHYEHLAPQLFRQTPVSVFVAPGGTMGTCMGIAQYAVSRSTPSTVRFADEKDVKVIPVMCAEGQEIPGARTLSRVKKDVQHAWREQFDETDIESGTRYASFLLSFLSWRRIPVQLGPSFGLALVGALKFLRKHKAAGTLDQFREVDSKVYVVVLGPDDYRPYTGLYLAHRLYDEDFTKRNLLDLVDLA